MTGGKENMQKEKIIFTTIASALWQFLGSIYNVVGIVAFPWLILLFLNVVDYGTGLAAAPYRNPDDEKPVKSDESVRGIKKKVGMHILVIVGWIIDWLIRCSIMSTQAGITFTWPPIFAVAIALWLTFDEIMSILENLEDIGTPIPPFLKPIMKMMRKQVENAVSQKEEEK